MKKRIVSLLLALSLLCSLLPASALRASAATSGTCGDNLTWTFDSSSGKLTIKGSGEMDDWGSKEDVPWHDYRASIKSLSLPSGLTGISGNAFAECGKLSSVVLPESLEKLGGMAFGRCLSLRSITIPAGLTECGWGDYYDDDEEDWIYGGPFNGCDNLETAVFADGTERIASNVFYHCTGLRTVTIPDGVTEIGERAFYLCVNLSSVDLSENLETLCGMAFGRCLSLRSITIPAHLTECGWDDYYDDDEGDWIYGGPFNGCDNLETAVFADGTERIASNVFYHCTGLRTVTIPDSAAEIGESAFNNCDNLNAIILSDGLTLIGTRAFQDCGSLEAVTIPDSVTEIGEAAFAYCDSLSSVVLSENLETMGGMAFGRCLSLRSITIPAHLTECGWDYYYDDDEGDWIYGGPFNGCDNLETAVFADGTERIASNVFYHCTGLRTVTIPDGVTEIGESAFEDCDNLGMITVPNTVTEIEERAFYDSDSLVICCNRNSYALIYAIENGLLFRLNGEFRDSPELILNRVQTEMRADLNAVSTNGTLPITVRFGLKDSWKDEVSDGTVCIYLPRNMELSESSLRLDGVLLQDYDYDGERKLEIPVLKDSGEIRLSAKMTDYGEISGYAVFHCEKDGEEYREIIGVLNEEIKLLSIEAPEVVSEAEVTVRGTAKPSAEITVYVDGEEACLVTALKNGAWSATVALPEPEDYQSFVVAAVCTDGDTELRKTVEVFYHEGEAELTDFRLYYNVHRVEVDLLNSGEARPLVYYAPGSRFDFELVYDHPDQINTLFVTSTRNNEKRFLEAVYDEATGKFVTNGYFDENDPNYVPGVIGIEYTLKTDPVLIGQDMDMSIFEEQLETLPEGAYQVMESSDRSSTVRIDLGSVTSDLQDTFIDAAVSIYDEYYDGDLETWMGLNSDAGTLFSYLVPGVDGETYIVDLDYSNPYTYVMIVRDLTGLNVVKYVLDSKISDPWTPDDVAGRLFDISETISDVNLITKMLYKTYKINKDMDQLREDVMMSPYVQDKEAALAQVEELRGDEIMFELMVMALPMLIAGAPLAIGATMTAPVIAFTALLGVISAMAPMFWQMRTAHIKGQSFRLNFVIDPSGYVYDNDTNERLEGVTATAYCIEYDESEGFWDEAPAADEYGTLWDASEYEQSNPLLTDCEGRYAWDVPEGWWRVKYEKEGYETVWSDWMPVPPVQTEVNIGITALNKVNPFTDVKADDWYYDSILWAFYHVPPITTGTTATTFAPKRVCSRSEVVTFLWRAAGQPEPTTTENPFTDVKTTDWYYKAVLWAVENGVTSGTGGTTFSPKRQCMRGEVVTFLWRAAGQPDPTSIETAFTDVDPKAYYYKAMLWAVEKGITKGTTATTFAPKKTCTRGEIVTFLYRAYS